MKTISTVHVATAPMPLITRDFLQCEFFSSCSTSARDFASSDVNRLASSLPVKLLSGRSDLLWGVAALDKARPRIACSDCPSCHQCTTIPACDNVNERNTPTA